MFISLMGYSTAATTCTGKAVHFIDRSKYCIHPMFWIPNGPFFSWGTWRAFIVCVCVCVIKLIIN